MRDLIQLVLRDESRHAGFGVLYLADKFRTVGVAERRRVEDFVAELWRLFHHATGSPFGPVNAFLSDTFRDIAIWSSSDSICASDAATHFVRATHLNSRAASLQ